MSATDVSSPGNPEAWSKIEAPEVFSSKAWGAWSVAIMSTVPSLTARQSASLSSLRFTEGLDFISEPSLGVVALVEQEVLRAGLGGQVASASARDRFAFLTSSAPAALLRWAMWRSHLASRASAIARRTAFSSSVAGRDS